MKHFWRKILAACDVIRVNNEHRYERECGGEVECNSERIKKLIQNCHNYRSSHNDKTLVLNLLNST